LRRERGDARLPFHMLDEGGGESRVGGGEEDVTICHILFLLGEGKM